MKRDSVEPRWLPLLRLVPNIVTLLGLCAGLTSIRFVLEERFDLAVALIVFAAVIDGLDGLLARRLKATSDFGAQIDSLADFLNFGVAPALVVFEFALGSAPGAGWTFLLVYASCCCLRLARFNVAKNAATVEVDTPHDSVTAPPELGEKAHFVGVPAPAGALLVLLPVFLSLEGIIDASLAPFAVALFMGLVGAGMVSTVRTISPKSIFIPREKIGLVMLATPLVAGVMLTQFWLSLIIIDVVYSALVLRSCVGAFIRRRGARQVGDAPERSETWTSEP